MEIILLLLISWMSCSTLNAQETPRAFNLKTNTLYDAALVPNIGGELYMGKDISLAGNYYHSWWSKDASHKYWRLYGGDVEVRKWWGKRAHKQQLSGAHAGAYFQFLTYDFETGGKGYLADKFTIGGGLSVGYSQPVLTYMDLDFTVGLGFLRGEYKEYIPQNGHYVWQCTKMRNYIGPTKLEVSLVFRLGRRNRNKHDDYCKRKFCRKRREAMKRLLKGEPE